MQRTRLLDKKSNARDCSSETDHCLYMERDRRETLRNSHPSTQQQDQLKMDQQAQIAAIYARMTNLDSDAGNKVKKMTKVAEELEIRERKEKSAKEKSYLADLEAIKRKKKKLDEKEAKLTQLEKMSKLQKEYEEMHIEWQTLDAQLKDLNINMDDQHTQSTAIVPSNATQ